MNTLQILAGKSITDLTNKEHEIYSGLILGQLVRLANHSETINNYSVIMNKYQTVYVDGKPYKIKIIEG